MGKEDFGPAKPWEEQRTVASWRFCPCHTLSVFICQMDLQTDIELDGGCFSRSNSHPESYMFTTWRIIPEGFFLTITGMILQFLGSQQHKPWFATIEWAPGMIGAPRLRQLGWMASALWHHLRRWKDGDGDVLLLLLLENIWKRCCR